MAERITGYTELIGLIAKPIRHSKLPTMHNEAFAKLGLDYAYLAFEVGNDTLENTIKGFKAMNVRGWNVSMPNKVEVIKYLDEISPAAQMCQSVNTVVNENGILKGYITDGIGYMKFLKEAGINIIDEKITLIGAGGAATAVQAALDGVKEISIFNRKDVHFERMEKIIEHIHKKTKRKVRLFELNDLEALWKEINTSVVLTNATGVGMKPFESQSCIPDTSFLRKDLIVTDVIYSPEETALLKMAREVGCTTFNGIGMMIYQGAAGFEMWTGKAMPIDYIKEVLKV